MNKRLKRGLMASYGYNAFRCAWYFFHFERTGEAWTEQPGEAVAVGTIAP